MEHELQIDFQLLGTKILPKDITLKLQIKPDLSLEKGERNMELVLPRENVWSLRSSAEADDLETHWLELERKLGKLIKKIRGIALTGRAKFTIIVSSENRIPSVIIPVSMSRFAAEVEAEIDIDHL